MLAGGVAHDFNNLLAAILGHASLALKQLPEGSPARRHVEKAAGAVERAADLTRQMLAYSGRGHFVVRPTDVNALVRENLPLLEVAVPKSVRLEARLDPDPPLVDADVGQIQQVLMNLVINAAEAIGERGGTVTVATGVREVTAADQRAVARERAAPRPGPLRVARGPRRRAGDGRGAPSTGSSSPSSRPSSRVAASASPPSSASSGATGAR